MNFFKKVFLYSLVVLIFFCVVMQLIGCYSTTNTKNNKYDVSIKVRSDDGEEWIFTPDIEEINITREYDGKEHKYYVSAYQLVNHPDFGEQWITATNEGGNKFQINIIYNQRYEVNKVCEKGEYLIHCTADATSDLWNFRSVNLKITVR